MFCFQKLLSYGEGLDKSKVGDEQVRTEAAAAKGTKGAVCLERGSEE